MSNNVNVSLDTTVDPPALKVHDHGHIKVAKKSTPQTISWNLTGTIAAGSFVAMDADPPGFRWVGDAPAAGIFGTPTVGSNGNSLSVTDTHRDAGSDGTWTYQLHVLYDGKTYSTTATTDPGTTINNPVIINR